MNCSPPYVSQLCAFAISVLGVSAQASDANAQAPAATHVTVLKAARLFDGTGGQPLTPAMVRIEQDKIIHVAAQLDVPSRAPLIALGSSTLLPGLIDLH